MKLLADEAAIKKLASNNKVFMRGRNLYNAKERVGPLFFDGRHMMLSAKVSSFSGHVYDTHVVLKANGAPVAASCSCNSFGAFKGCCKHTVALLLAGLSTDLPEEGLTPPELEAENPLRGVPLLSRPLLTMEELLQLSGPEDKCSPKKRGRPSKAEIDKRRLEDSLRREEERVSVTSSQDKIDLFTDETLVTASTEAADLEGEARYLPLSMLRGERKMSEQALAAGLELRADEDADLTGGERFIRRIFSWEEHECNLLHSRRPEPSSADTVIELHLELFAGMAQASQLSLRVGDGNHLYIVNQLGQWLRAYRRRETMELGSYYIWDGSVRLTREQQLFMDWLEETRPESLRQLRARDRQDAGDGKFLELSGVQLESLLDLCLYCGDQLPVYLHWDRRTFPLIIRRQLPKGLSAHLMETADGACNLVLQYNQRTLQLASLSELHSAGIARDGLIILREKGICLFDDVVYYCQEQADRFLWQIVLQLEVEPENRLSLDAAQASFFLGSAKSLILDDGRLTWDEPLQRRFAEYPLEIRVYIDYFDNTVRISPFFFYGDYHFRPLMRRAMPREGQGELSNALIVRDSQGEMSFENVLGNWGFQESLLCDEQLGLITRGDQGDYMANQFYVTGDKEIFRFITDSIQQIKEIAQVYVSPGFKTLEIRRPGKAEVGLSVDEVNSQLRVMLSMPGFDEEEAGKIVRGFQKKADYVRLNESVFVDLRERWGQHWLNDEFAKLVETLSSWGARWEQGQFLLPRYRGLALNRLLTDEHIAVQQAEEEEMEAWNRLMADMENPAAAAPELPEKVNAKLRPYQLQGYQWLCFLERYNLGGILADEMGLGKTLQMLVFLWGQYRLKASPMLIVAPTSLLYNRAQETGRFVPDFPCQVIEGNKPQRQLQYDELLAKGDQAGLIIISYGLARQDRQELRRFRFGVMVLDEAQNIKNPLTKTSRAVKSLSAAKRFALTGTPIENHIGELWSIFDFIMPGYLFSYSSFQERFGQIGQTLAVSSTEDEAPDDDWGSSEPEDPFRGERESVGQSLHRLVNPFILRRLKEDVLKDLPDKIVTDIPCAMTVQQQRVYREHLARAKRRLSEFELASQQEQNRKRMDILGELTRLRQICCDPSLFMDNYEGGSGKLDALEDLLDNLLEGGHRILLFSQFTSMLHLICERLKTLGISYMYIDGQVSSKNRLELVERFNQGEGKIFLISLKAGGTGLNLTGADVVIHFDPWWNPAVENQATDRAHRMGQRKIVQVFRMVTKGSIEEKIQEMQQRKQALLDDIVSPGATFINRMDLEDVRELFAD